MYSKNRFVIVLRNPRMIKKIEKRADELKISRTDVVRLAIAEYLGGDSDE